MSVFENIVNKSYNKIRLIVLTIVIYVLLPLSIPLLFVRLFVKFIATVLRKDLTSMVDREKVFISSSDVLNDLSRNGFCDLYGNFVSRLEFNGRLSIEAVQKAVKTNIVNEYYWEFSQYPEKFMGFLFWKKDKNFNIGNHVRAFSNYSHNRETIVQTNFLWGADLPTLIHESWVPQRSPWEILVTPVRTAENGNLIEKTIICMRVHYLLCDGISAMKIIEKIFGSPTCTLSRLHETFWTGKLPFYFRLGIFGLYDYMIQMKMCREKKWHSPIEFTRQRFFVWSSKIPCELIDNLQMTHKVSSTAIILTILSEGIRKHFIDVDIGVPDKMSITIPFPQENYNNANKLKHQLSYCPIKFPVYVMDAGKRLKKFEKYLQNVKKSTLPTACRVVCKFFGNLTIRWQNSPSTAFLSTAAIMNEITGPKSEIKFEGCELLDIIPGMGHLNGNSGFGLTTLKYNGFFRLCFTSQNCIITSEYEAHRVMDKICIALDDLKGLKI